VEVHDRVATMTQAPLEPGDEVDRAQVAAALQIAADGIVSQPRFYTTTGVRQLFAQVRDRELLRTVRADMAAIEAIEAADGVDAWCEHGDELAQRFFGPAIGVPEDPATGSAAGALGALRVYEGATPGTVLIRQGEEIGRPSEITVAVGGEPGAPEPPRVSGRAVLVMEGTIAPAAFS
jgi:PhzF family phenazine biosynthesis protein